VHLPFRPGDASRELKNARTNQPARFAQKTDFGERR
jgi:hypothetical protein